MRARIPVRVAEIEAMRAIIPLVTFVADEKPLPPFSAGSHVVVQMEGEGKRFRNAYSLISNPADSSHYRIAVRLQERSRGGSQFMHGEFRPGDRLFISPPANMFLPDWQARHHILIAGGIGITPFLSYGYELEQRQASFEVHYVYRNAETGAFREALTERFGNRLYCYSGERPDFYTLLGHQPLGTHVYVCGPEAMIQDVKATASALGWSPQRVHYDAFTAPQPGKPFVARLSRSHQDVPVAGDKPLRDALEAHGLEIRTKCRCGVCGQCKTSVVDGDIEHRDAFLDDQEKASQRCIMPCVSRSASDYLVLDL
nr:PDR/VanB family oxidoreductase [Halomonas sp.]